MNDLPIIKKFSIKSLQLLLRTIKLFPNWTIQQFLDSFYFWFLLNNKTNALFYLNDINLSSIIKSNN